MTQGSTATKPKRTPPALSREQREAKGKAARTEVPRSSHADFSVGPDRPDPLSLLEGQGLDRVPELLPIRYGRMASSAFAFFRGAALPMASDLARTPRSGLTVQACGDAHLANFGAFASPERNLVFDINDFDETLPGPWEWDVKRLATSLEIAGRSRQLLGQGAPGDRARHGRGVPAGDAEFAGMDALDVWYAHADVGASAGHRRRPPADRPAQGRSRATSPRRRPRTTSAPWAGSPVSTTARRG